MLKKMMWARAIRKKNQAQLKDTMLGWELKAGHSVKYQGGKGVT